MNPKTTIRHSIRQALVALLSVGLALGPLADAARAQTPLADIPIASKVTAKPNIVYTLDDSGSMQFNYLPDWVIAGSTTTAVTKITRVGAVATVQIASTAALSVGQFVIIAGANQPEYNGEFQIQTIPTGTTFTIAIVGAPVSPATGVITYAISTSYCRSGTSTAACSVGAVSTFNSPPFYAADFNHLAYDPNVNYQPPVKYDGTPLTHTIGSDTDALGNQIYSNVQPDPFTAPNAAHVNLTAKVAVPLYCNTDWPITKGGPTSNLTLADVGDANAENSPPVAGVGDWCRINGTEYKASLASGAPDVTYANGNLLYDYPYKSSSGATGAQYFYQQLANKVLYCDKTSPYWPKVKGGIIGCTAGGTPTCGGLPCAPVITKQTCNLSTPGKTCNPTPALRNFNPSVCKTPSALYCLPGVGGSDGFSPGTGTAPECLSCTCIADYQPASTKKCSVTGAACTTVCGTLGCNPAECPDQSVMPAPNGCSAGVPIYSYSPAASTACNAFLWDPVANAPSATTTLQDSNAQGYACRHNNQVYAVSGAPAAGGLFTYPRTNLGDVYAANKTGVAPYTQTGAFITATTSSCPTIGTTINIPRHYYTIDSVTFCDNVDTTVNGQWRGFGAGVCKPANDLTQFQNVKYGQFHRIGLWAGHPDYPYTDQATQLPLTRTFAQETTNYANWYAYYRLRAHSAKTTSSLAFNLLDDTYRVGFHTLGQEPPPIGPSPATNPPVWVDVDDFTPGPGKQRNLWWNALFAVPTVTNVKTPSLSALLRIGNLFETGGAGGLPANVYPLPAGAKDPLKDSAGNVVSCQSNYHIEFTDGFTNQIALPVFAKEQDDVTPATWPAAGLLPDGTANPDNVLPDLPNGAAWPPPFKWGTKPVQDTLADIAMYYWARDLRPGSKDDVPSWSGKTPNDVDPTKDVAWWQHVNFSALSFGSAGTLDVENQKATLDAMQPPPPPGANLQWPDLTNPNNPPLPVGNKGAVGIDDLWHATVNARGSFVFATSPLEVQYGLGAILAGISNQRKSRSGAAFSGQVLNASNDIIYEPTIEPGWGGDLLKVQIDSDPASPTVGQEKGTLWHAAAVLASQIKPAFVGDEPWMDESKRRIVTWNGTTRTAFRATAAGPLPALSALQLSKLSPNGFTQRRMVAYLRGGTTYTTTAADAPLPAGKTLTIEGTGIGQFRKRLGGALGDISNAQPLVVSAPVDPPIFNTGADPGYAGFVAAQKAAGYKDRIVAAANDGMVHVFDSVDGHEIFAYVPSSLLRTDVDANGRPTGLQALTFQDGGVPLYKHHFYVDSSPRTADVDFNSAGVFGGGDDWHTIVVGGMGKGGNAYYALDLTDGNATDEPQAAAKLLWEFSDADWKYTYGRPIIVKTYQYGWTVIVTSGYNNVSGEGRIYLLNPKTGKPQNPAQPYISTGAVSCLGPDGVTTQTSGLAQINGFTKDFHNQFVEQVYGGDLCGNLWRFDLTATSGNYPAPQLFALLTDPLGKPQPVTTAPQIEIDLTNGVDRYVFIGTGRLLDLTDLTTPTPAQTQTMYAIRDDKLDTPIPDGDPLLPIDARAFLAAVPAGGAPVAGGAPNGWYHDLPSGGTTPERIVVDVEADVNAVTYIGTQAIDDPCTIALPANIYAREFATATSLISDPKNGWFYHDDAGGVGMQIVGIQDPSTGAITLAGLLSHEVPGTKPIAFKNPSGTNRNRMSWRLLTGE